jgi:hypothetical protein
MTRVYPGSGRESYVQQRCARGAVLRCTVVLVERSYKQGGRRGKPPDPWGLIEAECQYRGEGGNVQVSSYPSSPAAKGRWCTIVSHSSKWYTWRHGAQCRGIDSCMGASRSIVVRMLTRGLSWRNAVGCTAARVACLVVPSIHSTGDGESASRPLSGFWWI